MKFKFTQCIPLLALFLFFQTSTHAQITEEVIGDWKFWATGKLKPISMTKDDRDPKVAVRLEEEFNGSVWYATSVDSSTLDNACKRLTSARYTGGLNQPFKLNVVDTFGIVNGTRLLKTITRVYNTSGTLTTLSIGSYYYIGTTRSEPDSINTSVIQGAAGTIGRKKATFVGLNQIGSITLFERVGTVYTPTTRTNYQYSSGNLTNVTVENWDPATKNWTPCTTCENITIRYDNISRIIEQVKNRSNGDSVRYLLTYIGTTSRVKTITTQVKANRTTTWVQESIADNKVQNVSGYPTLIDYFDGSDSIKIAYQYQADTSMTLRLISVKNGAVYTNVTRVTQAYCSPCLAALPIIQQPPPSTNMFVGRSDGILVSGSNIASAQWQVSTNSGGNWTNINPADTTIYKVNNFGTATSGSTVLEIKAATISQNGYQFRAIVNNGCGGTVTSSVSTLSVQACNDVSPTIQGQTTFLTSYEGQSATFAVIATNVSTYQWFYYLPNDTINGTTISPSDTTFSGQQTDVLRLKYVKSSYNGYSYRCVLRNGCALPAATNSIKLTALICTESFPTIQGQPSNTTVNADAPATFSIVSNTPAVSFRWQVKLPGTTVWRSIFISDTTYLGQTTNTLTVKFSKYAYNRYAFRCFAVNCVGTTYSDSSLLTVRCPGGVTTITSQVASVTTTVGTPRRIDVTGTNIVGAQWQVSNTSSGAFNNILATDTTYTIGANTATNANITIKYPKIAQNGFRYRVILTNSCSDSLISTGTSLVVNFSSAINELDAKVRVYPNPTDNLINIDLPMLNFKVTLMDSKGSVILKSENSKQISLEELPTGIYFLNLKTIEGETTKKVIKY
jgi:hypothetical protein